MEQYTISINKKSIKNKLINNSELDIDYCCKSKDVLTVYAKDITIRSLRKEGYNFIKTPVKKLVKNKSVNKTLGMYHYQNDLEIFIKNICNKYPLISSFKSIGKTAKSRDLFMTEFTSKDNKDKPSFLIVANIHGNETLGRELSLYLMDYLCKNYESDPLIRYLMDNTRIFILPSLNPDGFENTDLNGNWRPSRYNSNGVDLNRNFPDKYKKWINKHRKNRENEVNAIIDWSKTHEVKMSLSIHGGALVVNYPLDGPVSNIYSKSKHDEFFKYISKQYVKNNNDFNSRFKNGITNGSEWYAIFGGMQDWQYINNNTFEITLELSKEKIVEEVNLEKYWLNNVNSFINSIKLLHIGLNGRIIDTSVKNLVLLNTTLNNSSKIDVSSNGFFCIPLKPGDYVLEYQDLQKHVTIKYREEEG